MKDKFLKDGEAQRYHLWVEKSELQTGGSWESILWNYHSKLFFIFFPLHPLLLSLGGGVLNWLAGLMQIFLC